MNTETMVIGFRCIYTTPCTQLCGYVRNEKKGANYSKNKSIK